MARCSAVVLALALVIIVAFVSTAQAKDWWQTAVIYQIYVRSFKDSNADGIGDINGIIEKLPYIQGLGVEAICLSPIFRSPMLDQGYDISDFRAVDPMYGGNEALDKLIKKAKERNIKVLLDFVPNHSSDQHDWFRRSSTRVAPYTDYYVWRDGRPNPQNYSRPNPPNNWLSRYGGSAWEWSPERHQFYLHTYSARQPDLNFRYPPVAQEIKESIKYWLQKGVDGFRMVGVVNLYESPSFFDEPQAPGQYYNPTNYDSLSHPYTTNLNETLDMVRQWRQIMDKYKQETKSSTRLLIVDANTDVDHILSYYGNSSHPGALPTNPVFIGNLNSRSRASDFAQAVHKWHDFMHDGRWANWMLGTPDVSRVASRIGQDKVDSMHMLSLLLPGTAFTYYGEELGMTDTTLRRDQTNDPWMRTGGVDKTRDPARTPFQWDSTTSAGFSVSSSPWLPVNPNFRDVNLNNQQRDKRSHYSTYRRLVASRQESAIAKGAVNLKVHSESVLSFSRTYKDHDTFVVVINLGDATEEVKLKDYNLPKSVLVHTASKNSKLKQGDSVSPKKIELQPNSAVVLTTGKVKDYKYNRAGPSVQLSSAVLLALGVTLPVFYSICN
ncbi:maltase 2 [Anabrus simplex]|uniref:maltase 2 n=1 Tax=Anabrus simplex TaxID=316456 RepID=UPI0035A2FD77